jgi:hypothetical protein
LSLRGEEISKPGETIGINKLISAQPGLVPQEKGIFNQAQVWAATMFVDYVNGYVHVGLMTDQSGDSTLQSKHDFEHLERIMQTMVVLQNAHSQMMSSAAFNVSDSVE